MVSKHIYPFESTDYAVNICYRNLMKKYKDEFKELNIIPTVNVFQPAPNDISIYNKLVLEVKAYEVDELFASRYWDDNSTYMSFLDWQLVAQPAKILFIIRCEEILNI